MDHNEHPFGAAQPTSTSTRLPEWLPGVAILGGAALCFLGALYLIVSLYQNRVMRHTPEPTSTTEVAKPEEDPPSATPGTAQSGTGEPGSAPWSGKEILSRTAAQEGALRLELERLTPLTFPGQGAIFFKALVRNTGKGPVGFAKVEVKLEDSGDVVESRSGYVDLHTLFPGERTAVTVLFSKPGDYTKAWARFEPLRPPYQRQARVRLRVLSPKVVPKSSYSFGASGIVKNEESFRVGSIRVFAILYGQDDSKLVGTGTNFVRGTLEPGAQKNISFEVMPTHGSMTRFEFLAEGKETK